MSMQRNDNRQPSNHVSNLLILSIATWNVWGIAPPSNASNAEIRSERELKRELLARDAHRYGLDIVGIQETKCTIGEDLDLPGGYRLVIFDQLKCRHGGVGFIISPRMRDHVSHYVRVSDRVCYLDFNIPLKGGGSRKFRVVNCYGLTQFRANEKRAGGPRKVKNFYSELSGVCNVPRKWELYVIGDFNSKLGLRTNHDVKDGLSSHIGAYGMGTRNLNGESLLQFIVNYDLAACNTFFDHPCRHRTTYEGKSETRVTKHGKPAPIYTQIDFVLCRRRSVCLMKDARSYAGAEHKSDHRIVVCRLTLDKYYLVFKKKPPAAVKHCVTSLWSDRDLRHQYQDAIRQTVNSKEYPDDPSERLDMLEADIKDCAEKTLGIQKGTRKPYHSDDPKIKALVRKKNDLRSNINSSADQRREIMKDVRLVERDIRKRLVEVQDLEADRLAEIITNTDDTRQMFEASRTLACVKPGGSISVHNESSQEIGSDREKTEVLRLFYEKQFAEGVDVPLPAFIGEGRPLNNPISKSEVAFAARKLKSNRATGPDQIQNELLKYADPTVYNMYAGALNDSFTTNNYIKSIGEGILTPLQKPGKPKGPATSLRPLTLLNGMRKMLTLIALRRVEDVIDEYTMSWQSGYKHGRSCSDIVWAQRMLTSIVMRKKWSYCKLGIDMSRAFDTVRRDVIIDVLRDAGASEDDIRIVQYLLSNTKLRVRVNSTFSEVFETLLGAFQGDSLSGKLFTLILAAALHHLRAVSDRPNPPISDLGLPTELAYADDNDFLDTNMKDLEALYPIAKDVLQQWNLFVNDSKTEYTKIHVATKKAKGPDGKPLKGNEPWRSSKLLGSLLCSNKDIDNRCNKGWQAFTKFEKIWLSGKKISLSRKLKLYEAQVVSVMLYNANSWAARGAMLNKLDITHRKHLRKILNIRWPKSVMSNKTLYERCQTRPLSERVDEMRWRMFGHILRSDDNTPANVSLVFAVTMNSKLKGRVGSPGKSLLKLLMDDLEDRNLVMNTLEELNEIKDIARCRQCWRNLL